MVFAAKPCGLASAIARVAHEDELSLRKPAHQARQQEPGEVGGHLMPRAMHAIPLRGRYKAAKTGRAQGRVVNGNLTSTDRTTHL